MSAGLKQFNISYKNSAYIEVPKTQRNKYSKLYIKSGERYILTNNRDTDEQTYYYETNPNNIQFNKNFTVDLLFNEQTWQSDSLFIFIDKIEIQGPPGTGLIIYTKKQQLEELPPAPEGNENMSEEESKQYFKETFELN